MGWAHPAGPTSLKWTLGGQSLAPNCLWPMHHHYLPISQDPKYYIGARRFRYVHTLPPWYGLPYRGLKMVHLITGQIKPKGPPNTVPFLNKFRGNSVRSVPRADLFFLFSQKTVQLVVPTGKSFFELWN